MKFTINVFDEMEYFWAEIADKNQTESQIIFLKNHLERKGVILDAACGTGRHLISLSKIGFEVVGIDVSAKLLRIAKQRYQQACLVRGDIRLLPFTAETFTAAISVDTTLGYAPSEQNDQQILVELKKALRQRGILVLDVFNREYLICKYGKRTLLKNLKWAFLPLLLRLHNQWLLFNRFKWREYPSFFLLQKRGIRLNGQLLFDLWIVWEKSAKKLLIFNHYVRLYRYDALKELLACAGFNVNRVYGDYKEQELREDSPRLIFIIT